MPLIETVPIYLLWFWMLLIIFGRYVFSSWVIDKLVRRVQPKLIFDQPYKYGQIKKEIRNSLFSAIIFSFGFVHLLYLITQNKTAIHQLSFNVLAQALWLILALFIHETYYYWLHRVMHHRLFYQNFHKAHHDSVIVSAWTSFSFAPLEAIIQLLFFYFLVFLIPLHIYTLIFMLIFMTISAVINHLNIEIYPKSFGAFPLSLLIGATHHAFHHKDHRTNFGLYFTFWDQWMSTENSKFSNQV